MLKVLNCFLVYAMFVSKHSVILFPKLEKAFVQGLPKPNPSCLSIPVGRGFQTSFGILGL